MADKISLTVSRHKGPFTGAAVSYNPVKMAKCI